MRRRWRSEYVADATRERLARFIGDCTTEPRDLAEYDALPCLGHMTPETALCPPTPPTSASPSSATGSKESHTEKLRLERDACARGVISAGYITDRPCTT